MSKVPGTATFVQPDKGSGKTSSAKNKGKVGFTQPKTSKGKTKSGMMNVPGKVGFTQPDKGKTGTSTKKNPSKVGFEQPNRAGKTAAVPKYEGKNIGKGAKIKAAGKVAPPAGKFKSTDDLVAYRKNKYGA